MARAAAYLQRAQNLDGGFPQQPGGTSNAQSTAWAVQGLVAAGRNVSAITRAGGRSPLGYLRSLIMPDGSVRYSRTGSQTPVWVTAQALTALARRPFPIAPVTRPRARRSGSPAASPRRPPAPPRAARSPAARRAQAPPVAATAAAVIGALAAGTVEPLMRGLSGAL